MENYKYMKVEQLENKNQFVIYTGDARIFQSYNSVIAIYEREKPLLLGKDWDYSKTTLKHLYIFLEHYVYCDIWDNRIKYCKNKRKAIQEAINEGLIKYDEELI